MKNKDFRILKKIKFIFLTTGPFSLLPPRGKTQRAIPLLVCSLLGRVIEDYITVGLQYGVVETRILQIQIYL